MWRKDVDDGEWAFSLHSFAILTALVEAWDKASTDLFESFRQYDESGSPQRIQVLKYLVLTYMLMGSEINPFDSQETKPWVSAFKPNWHKLNVAKQIQEWPANHRNDGSGICLSTERCPNGWADTERLAWEQLLRCKKTDILIQQTELR